jgi:flagellar hook assembly protein FlgD
MKDASGISGELLSFQATGEVKLSKVEAVDVYGSTVKVVTAAKIIPDKFALYQNYPNPFNPETKISYALPTDCYVKLAIYNISGQKVKTLVDEKQSAGYKNAVWNGKNEQGLEASSGIYFYVLKAGTYSETRKMVRIR